jgi:hypothetical protein
MSLPENVPVETLVLDKPRRLAFTLGALRRLRQHNGYAYDAQVVETSIDRIPVYVWAMLIPEDRDNLTVEDIEDMLHYGNVGEAIAVVAKLANLSTDDEAGKVEAVESPST